MINLLNNIQTNNFSAKLLKGNKLIAEVDKITLTLKDPTKILIKKNKSVPLYFSSKKIEYTFKAESSNLSFPYDDLEEDFSVDIYDKGKVIVMLNGVTLTLVNEVQGMIEGYAKECVTVK